MKKLLLTTLAIISCLTITAGEWTLPLPKTVPVQYGQTYYFYNTGAKLFLSQGNSYGTQMSMGESGLPVVIKEKTDAAYNDGGTYVMLWNDDAKAYFDWDANGKQGWVDRDEATALVSEKAVWKFKINDDGTFMFGIPNHASVCEHPDFDENGTLFDLWGGWNGVYGNTEVIPYINPDYYENACTTWNAVTVEEYTAFVATYGERKSLYDLIISAEANGVEIPARIANVFNKADATKDELNATKADLANVILKHELDVNGEADVTSQYIINPNFDNENKGWSNSVDFAYVAEHGYWVEKTFQPTGDTESNTEDDVTMSGYIKIFCWSGGWVQSLNNNETSQTFTLPAGRYRLEADCFAFQEGDGAEQYGSPQDFTNLVKGFYLFVKTELGEERAEVKTAGKKPKHYVVEFASTGGEVTIGLKIDDCFGSMFGGDNFRLYCTSIIASPNVAELAAISKDLNTLVEAYTDAPFSLETLTQAETFVKQSEDVIQDEDDEKSVTMLSQGKDLLALIAQEIAAYSKVASRFAEANAQIQNGDFDVLGDEAVNAIRDNAYFMMEKIEKGEVTASQAYQLIDDYVSKLAYIFAENVNLFDEGLDVTCLLANGSMTIGQEWYSGNGSNTLPGWDGTRPWGFSPQTDVPSVIEYLNQDFDIYQQLRALPQGVYTLEFRGLYRWAEKDSVISAIGTEKEISKNVSRFYLNDFEAPIMSITDDPFVLYDDEEANAGNYATGLVNDEGIDLYIPDAQWYFLWRHTENYINRGAVLVEENGDLRIGFRAASQEKDHWALINAPRLRYEGTSERAMQLLQALSVTAPTSDVVNTTYYNLNGTPIPAPQRGVNIVVSRFSDGTTRTHKVAVK